MAQTEVHTYAFSVAANTILSLFPFIVMMFTIARLVFHSHAMESAIADMIRYFLPTGQEFVTKNMEIVAHARSGVQLASVVMLLISSTGVFLPLEVALNRVWGVTRNRSYLMNQLVSLGLAAGIGTVALLSVAVTAAQQSVLQFLFFGHINNVAFVFVSHWLLQISAAVASVLLFFLIYWILPNRKLPVRAVLPTAIVIGLSWELAKMLYIGGPALDGPSFGLRSLLRLRQPDVVGLRHRPAVVGGRPLLGLTSRSASRLPGRPGASQRRKDSIVASERVLRILVPYGCLTASIRVRADSATNLQNRQRAQARYYSAISTHD